MVMSMGVELHGIGELKEAVGVMEMSSDSCLSDAGTLLMQTIVQKEDELKGRKDGNVVTISGMLLKNERFGKREEIERSEKEKEKKEREIVMKANERMKRELEELKKKSEDERTQFQRERNEIKQEIKEVRKRQSPSQLPRFSFNFVVFLFFF
jgi:hypothetical protein